MVGYYSIINENTFDVMMAWFVHLDMVTLALPLLYVVAGLLVLLEHTDVLPLFQTSSPKYYAAV